MSLRTGALLLSFAVGVSLAAQVAPPPNQPPTFRAGVEYVEVDVRVVNKSNEPVVGLAQRDFQVFEDGVKQEIASFTAVNIPVPSSDSEFRPRKPSPVELLRPDTAANTRQLLDGRIYLIALDDLYIDPGRTTGVRRFLSEFIDRSIGPADQAAVVSLGQGGAFQNFTNDKALLKSAVDQLSAGKKYSQTVEKLAFDLEQRGALVSGKADRPPVDTGPV